MGLDNLPEIMTIEQLSEALQVSRATINRAIKSGELKALKIGRNVRIEKESVIEWAKEK